LAIKQLDGIGSSLSVPTKSGRINSLGDGMAQGLIRFCKAKEMFGLKNMLLGDFDLALLDERMRGDRGLPPNRSAAPVKPAAKSAAPAAAPSTQGSQGSHAVVRRVEQPPAKSPGGNGGKKGNGLTRESNASRPDEALTRDGSRMDASAETLGGERYDSATAIGGPAFSSKRQGLLSAFKLKCPECGSTLSFQEGCVKCPGCGYSQC
jgi:hypothetical protein